MKCPNCGAEMKTCCQLVAEAQRKAGIIYQHSCGPSEWVCERCGHRQYVTGFISLSYVNPSQPYTYPDE